MKLREKEKKLVKDQLDGIDTYVAGSADLNYVFDRCENETNVKVIQTIMGHASIETTMDIYTEVTHDKKQEALEALSKNLDVF